MLTTQKIFFSWKPEYNVNHPAIDRQHQRLCALMNELFAAMSEGKGRTAIGGVLKGLVDYTRTHFSFEEQEMARAGYTGLAQHKEYHRKLLQQVDEYVRQWEAGQSVMAVDLSEFLKKWLLDHIGQNDRPLAAFLDLKN